MVINSRRMIISVLALIVVVTLVGVSWLVGGRLIAPANRPVGMPPIDWNSETVTLDSASGSSIAAWHAPNADASATVILLHPLRGSRQSMIDRATLLLSRGYAVLLIDFQAHGESPGQHITVGHLERHDVKAAVTFVRETNPDHRIGIIGVSLGGAAALLAGPLEVDALVLEAVYPSVSEAVHNRIARRLGPLHHVLAPALLVQLRPRIGVSPSDLRPIDRIGDVGCPVLITAGDQDTHTPADETRALHEAAVEPRQLTFFEGAAHVDLLTFDPERYARDIVGFLDEHLRR